MKMIKWLIVVFSLSILLPACVNTIDNSESQSANAQWLQSLVCEFPCWEHITPHETNFDEVVSILQSAKITIRAISEDEISFVLDETVYGSIHKTSDGRVDPIILDVHNEGLTLDDLKPASGNPGKIALSYGGYTPDCQAYVLYPTSGVILDTMFLNNSARNKSQTECRVEITPDTQIFRIVLIGSDLENSEFWKQSYSRSKYVKWKGYGEYP